MSVLAIAPVLNEQDKIRDVIVRVPEIVDEVLVVDDGSTDHSPEIAGALGASVIRMGRVAGVGAAIREGFRYSLDQSFDVVVVMAGNNKDAPEEIPLLLDPIANGEAHFVQGSRWLKEHRDLGPMPLYRKIATRLHPLLFSVLAGRRVTDSTNGFRAMRTSILRDGRLDLGQSWLDQYELEPYLYLKAIKLGYRTAEVPVTKTYPPKALGQTKMKPIVGWWSMLRPLFFVGLGLRR